VTCFLKKVRYDPLSLGQLRQSGQDVALSMQQSKKGLVKLVSTHCYNTGTTLYYIPVLPLYRLLQDKKQKHSAELLLSVFAYLYHIVGIPYYRDDSTELAYQYECIEDWIMQDLEEESPESANIILSQVNAAAYYGDVMERKIYNFYNLNCFEKRVAKFKASTAFEQDCLSLAKRAWQLFQQFPNGKVFRNMQNQEFEDDYDEIIRAEQYISFIAETDGRLYDTVAEMVNSVFNECREMEIPTLTQVFDGQHEITGERLDFEYSLFPFLEDLCTLLDEMP
jgi:hypothetical protein